MMSSIEPPDFRAAWAQAAVSVSIAPYVMAAEAARTAVEVWGRSLECMTSEREPTATATVIHLPRSAPRSWYKPPDLQGHDLPGTPLLAIRPATAFGFAALTDEVRPRPQPPAPSPPDFPRNVIDFATAYSTYRTAGGHACAQVHPPRRSPKQMAEDEGRETAALAAWPFALFFPPWLPYYRR